MLIFVTLLFFFSPVQADEPPPLPLHGIEGYGGIFSTYSAYLVNGPSKGNVLGKPSLGIANVEMGEGRHLIAATVTQMITPYVELGYAYHNLNIGDLPQDIYKNTELFTEEQNVIMHNLNLRINLLKEGAAGQKWIPAVTAGIHYKTNTNIFDLNEDLTAPGLLPNGALKDVSGIKDDSGIDYTLYITKMIPASRPLLINLGLRNSEAAHLGLLGFTGERKTTFEGNIVWFAGKQFALAAEYRQKPNEYNPINSTTTGLPIESLVGEEEDWWTICFGYVVNSHFTFSGGYGHFGEVLNHDANASWGIKMKFEF